MDSPLDGPSREAVDIQAGAWCKLGTNRLTNPSLPYPTLKTDKMAGLTHVLYNCPVVQLIIQLSDRRPMPTHPLSIFFSFHTLTHGHAHL